MRSPRLRAMARGRSTLALVHMEGASGEYTALDASRAGRKFWAISVTAALCLLSLLLSWNCFFNAISLSLLIGLAAVTFGCILFAALWEGPYDDRGELKRPEWTTPRALARVGLYGWFAAFALLSGALFLSARHPERVTVRVTKISKYGRGCQPDIIYFDPEISRTLSICQSNVFFPVQVGDDMVVVEDVGPLGARVQGVTRR